LGKNWEYLGPRGLAILERKNEDKVGSLKEIKEEEGPYLLQFGKSGFVRTPETVNGK